MRIGAVDTGPTGAMDLFQLHVYALSVNSTSRAIDMEPKNRDQDTAQLTWS